MLNVLLVEDNLDLALSVIDHLAIENISCDHAANGAEGLALIKDNYYEVILLDINIPSQDGLSLCKEIRTLGNDTPVMMLTARDTLENKLEGFRAGADDYLVKPFEIEELIVRLHALSKRRSGQVLQLAMGPLSLNLNNRSGKLNDEPLKLTPTAFKLLETLLRASPHPVSHQDLTQKVWGDEMSDSNKLRVHIHKLRKLLSAGDAEQILKTVPGYGFQIAA